MLQITSWTASSFCIRSPVHSLFSRQTPHLSECKLISICTQTKQDQYRFEPQSAPISMFVSSFTFFSSAILSLKARKNFLSQKKKQKSTISSNRCVPRPRWSVYFVHHFLEQQVVVVLVVVVDVVVVVVVLVAVLISQAAAETDGRTVEMMVVVMIQKLCSFKCGDQVMFSFRPCVLILRLHFADCRRIFVVQVSDWQHLRAKLCKSFVCVCGSC